MEFNKINHFEICFGFEVDNLYFMPKDIIITVNNLSNNIYATHGDYTEIPSYDSLDIIFTNGKDKEYDQHNGYSLSKIKEYKNNGIFSKMTAIVIVFQDGRKLDLFPNKENMKFIETNDPEVLHVVFLK